MKRRAPKGGYAFAEKAQYRQAIWSLFRDATPKPGLADVFLMPSAEGTEIDVALSKGFRQERMHVCDFNPAIVANLKRRYPAIHTYGVSAERAVERIAASGVQVRAANFDFTSCANDSFRLSLHRMAVSGAFSRNCAIAFTLLRGRETGAMRAFIVQADALPECRDFHRFVASKTIGKIAMTQRDAARIAFAGEGVAVDGWELPYLHRCGAYQSGSQTMLWAMFKRFTGAESIKFVQRHKYVPSAARKMFSAATCCGALLDAGRAYARILRETEKTSAAHEDLNRWWLDGAAPEAAA